MARKVSIFRRGDRWGYMVRVNNKITKSGSADTRAEAERKAGGGGGGKKKGKRKAKKKAAKKRGKKKRTRVSAAGCVLGKKGKTGSKTYRQACGPSSPRSASRAGELLSEYGHGEQKGRKQRPKKKAAKKKAAKRSTGSPLASGRKALRSALRKDA